jgi:hypothetical protein
MCISLNLYGFIQTKKKMCGSTVVRVVQAAVQVVQAAVCGSAYGGVRAECVAV